MLSILKRIFGSGAPAPTPQRQRVMAIGVDSNSMLRRIANNDTERGRAPDKVTVDAVLRQMGLTIENRGKVIGGLAGIFDSEMRKHVARRSRAPSYLGREDD